MKKLILIFGLILSLWSCNGQVPGIGGMQNVEVLYGSSGWGPIGSATYDEITFGISSSIAPNVQGIEFSLDGTRLYTVNPTNDSIHQFNLSVPYDIESISREYGFKNTYEASPRGICLSDDGYNMYVIGDGSDRVRQWVLSTAWEISTATYSSYFSVSLQTGYPYGLDISSDGSQMYVVSYYPYGHVFEYALSTPYLASSANVSYVSLFNIMDSPQISSGNNYCYSVKISDDGSKLYVSNNNYQRLYEFILTTPFDISSAVYNSELSVAHPSLYDFDIINNGTILITLNSGSTVSTLYQWTMGN